jgi:SAM-dependent methyltransferase
MENKDVFQTIIRDYEAARPGYPDELFCDIIQFAGLSPQARLLEIGAGPGQATEYFVRRGFDITALEISEKQVAFLREKFAGCGNFRAICSTFEEFGCDEGSFDLIFSATAFHWIKPEIGYPKAFHLLKEHGTIAVFWHLASIIEPKTALLQNIRAIYRRHAPQLDDYLTDAEAAELHQQRLTEIQTDQLFQSPLAKLYRWEDVYPAERYLRLMNSYSDFHSIEASTRNAILHEVSALLDHAGGSIVIPQEVRLYLARKCNLT